MDLHKIVNVFKIIITFLLLNCCILCNGQKCPKQGCTVCTPSYAECVYSDAVHICPKDLPATVTNLTLHHIGCGGALSNSVMKHLTQLESFTVNTFKFKFIVDNTFLYNKQLTYLVINHGQLHMIRKLKAFMGLTNLKSLDLYDTDLKMSEIKTNFQYLPSLQTLNLGKNNVAKVSSTFFTELKDLRELYLASSQIDNIDPDAFKNLNNLKIINLASNKLKTFSSSWFAINGHIYDMIDLSSNMIETLDSTSLKGLQVNELRLNNNPLTSISEGDFQEVKLQSLDLRGTKLVSLPHGIQGAFNKPSQPTVSPGDIYILLEFVTGWKCECQTLWLIDFLQTHTGSSSPTCTTSNIIPGVDNKALSSVADVIRNSCVPTTTSTKTAASSSSPQSTETVTVLSSSSPQSTETVTVLSSRSPQSTETVTVLSTFTNTSGGINEGLLAAGIVLGLTGVLTFVGIGLAARHKVRKSKVHYKKEPKPTMKKDKDNLVMKIHVKEANQVDKFNGHPEHLTAKMPV